MHIIDLDKKYLTATVKLAQNQYHHAQRAATPLYDKDYSTLLVPLMDKLFDQRLGAMMLDNHGKLLGYLAFRILRPLPDEHYFKAYSPVHCYGIRDDVNRSKVISMLFQHVAKKLVHQRVSSYEIKVYAYDQDILTSYFMNQFGVQCSDTIKHTSTPIKLRENSSYTYKELSPHEIKVHQKSLLSLWGRLRHHLRQSPTFYPGCEFTDDLFISHISSPQTRIFVAMNDDNIIGMLDASEGGNSFCNLDKETINLGDLYILEDYRGLKVAQCLLQYAQDALRNDGYQRLWVEHGTTNPLAVGFWDKYFTPYSYTLTRTIDPAVFNHLPA